MEWYFIKDTQGWYVKITVAAVEFCPQGEEDFTLFGYEKVSCKESATKFDLSSQAWNMMYNVVREEGFDVFIEEMK